jgi:hypothetical protein
MGQKIADFASFSYTGGEIRNPYLISRCDTPAWRTDTQLDNAGAKIA